MGASLTAPGSMRMDSRHFLALLPECRSKRVKEKSGRPWPPATRCSQLGLRVEGRGRGRVVCGWLCGCVGELAWPTQPGGLGAWTVNKTPARKATGRSGVYRVRGR